MNNYRIKIYLDSLRAGHAYLELLEPGKATGDTFGFYPAKFEEKREVLSERAWFAKTMSD